MGRGVLLASYVPHTSSHQEITIRSKSTQFYIHPRLLRKAPPPCKILIPWLSDSLWSIFRSNPNARSAHPLNISTSRHQGEQISLCNWAKSVDYSKNFQQNQFFITFVFPLGILTAGVPLPSQAEFAQMFKKKSPGVAVLKSPFTLPSSWACMLYFNTLPSSSKTESFHAQS